MNYQKGYKGEDLKQYQEKLGITADGIFGKETDKAVRDFQTQNEGLKVDGIIGKNTINAFSSPTPKRDNIINVNNLDSGIDMGNMPTATPQKPTQTDFSGMLQTAQDFYKEDEATTLERQRQQGIVSALQGQGGREEMRTGLEEELGVGKKRDVMTRASSKMQQLQAEEDTLYDQMRQEEAEGRGLRTTSAFQGEATRRARRIGIDKRYAAADLMAAQGDFQGAMSQVNQAVDDTFADRTDALNSQKQQLD